MEFDWRRAIEINSEALCTIAARLIVMAGIQGMRTASCLPRHLYLRILSLLRPAEYAARRLIVMAACKLVTVRISAPGENAECGLPLAKDAGSAKPVTRDHSRPFWGRCPPGRGGYTVHIPKDPPLSADADISPARGRVAAPPGNAPAFALFDPFKRFGHPWLEPDDIGTPDGDGFQPALPPDEPVDARSLCRRIRALANALGDLEGQALRLARWRARQHLPNCKPKRWSPMRPGRPPGYARRPKTEIEELLKECHFLARDAWDTS